MVRDATDLHMDTLPLKGMYAYKSGSTQSRSNFSLSDTSIYCGHRSITRMGFHMCHGPLSLRCNFMAALYVFRFLLKIERTWARNINNFFLHE